MKDLIVVTASTIPASDPRSGTLALYLTQLDTAGIDSNVQSLPVMPMAEGGAPGTLELFISVLRDIASEFSDYERIVATDGWDVTFYGSKEDVIRKIPMDRPLIGAAKECYPWGVAEREPREGETPWRYANGGLIAGTPAGFIRMADGMAAHCRYRPRFENQGMLNVLLAEGSDLFYHDTNTKLFFCLFDGYPELDFENGLPVNMLCGTHPQWIHANGRWNTAEMKAKLEASLKHPNSMLASPQS